jgi:archaellum component FlaC
VTAGISGVVAICSAVLATISLALGQFHARRTATRDEINDLRARVTELEREVKHWEIRYSELKNENDRLMKKLLSNGTTP